MFVKIQLSEEESGCIDDIVSVLEGNDPGLYHLAKNNCLRIGLSWSAIYFYTVLTLESSTPELLEKLRSWDCGKEEMQYNDGYGYPNYPRLHSSDA